MEGWGKCLEFSSQHMTSRSTRIDPRLWSQRGVSGDKGGQRTLTGNISMTTRACISQDFELKGVGCVVGRASQLNKDPSKYLLHHIQRRNSDLLFIKKSLLLKEPSGCTLGRAPH